MKKDITKNLIEEHTLILRMLTVLGENAALTAEGKFDNYGFYLEAVRFIRNYADTFHHAKEEDILFEALVKNGMPRENSPVAAMLLEHDHGRAYVKAMEAAAQRALAGEAGQNLIIAENAMGYIDLLRDHIDKEDTILYPLAERVIPVGMRDDILQSYMEAEAKTPTDFGKEYQKLVERYEAAKRAVTV